MYFPGGQKKYRSKTAKAYQDDTLGALSRISSTNHLHELILVVLV
jgi:hypothetical protein